MENIGFLSYAAAGIVFLLLALLLAVGWKQKGPGTWLIAACGLTAVWALTVAAGLRLGGSGDSFPARPLEIFHLGGWLAFLLSLLSLHWRQQGRPPIMIWVPVTMVLGLVVVAAVDIWAAFATDIELLKSFYTAGTIGRLALCVTGWVLIENLYRNTEYNDRWKIRFFCLALAGLFGFDFYLNADALLLRSRNELLFDARGFAITLIVPLIAVAAARNRKWSLEIFISRRFAFHSVSLVAGGIYLLVMAAAGYYIRVIGGQWGSVFQITFLFGALLLLTVVLFSGRFQTQIRVFLNKHFYHYKYDYRDEWQRFITTISSDNVHGDLQQRAIQAVADIADSPGGGLWMHGDTDHYALAALWNFHPPATVREPVTGPLARFLANTRWVVNLQELTDDPDLYDGFVEPEWLRSIERAWLVVPLVHRKRLVGFIVLGEPRAPKELNWEDRDLLKTVGRQIASYLAEQAAQKALSEARQFEDFNRRFAFVLHDIKNLVSQLSLLAKNAGKHAGNPEFQADMIATVTGSVDKMNRLLTRLHGANEPRREDGNVDLVALLSSAVKERITAAPGMRLDSSVEKLHVAGDGDRLSTAFGHLIQNAVDAVEGKGEVKIRLRRDHDTAVIEIEDDGPGMDPEFVRTQLFSPFSSTKSTGYGIGAFESRQVIKDLGGELDVDSVPDKGTIMHIRLPVCENLQ